jgi:hypothetical protein
MVVLPEAEAWSLTPFIDAAISYGGEISITRREDLL